jgi:Ser/Thr protein kinase RdoA (MazF antagonist)
VFATETQVLRARPRDDAGDPAGDPAGVPAWVERLSAAGAPVAAVRRSMAGSPQEGVRWGEAPYAVSCYDRVAGEVRGAADVGLEGAARWGAALAELHATTAPADGLPSWLDDRLVPAVSALVQRQHPAADVARALLGDVAGMPRASGTYGPLHGDPELDNVVWAEEGPVFVDLDDAALGWFVADVGFALRELAPPGAAPDLSLPVAAAFLAGYRSRRPLGDGELARLPLFARAHAVVTLARLQPVLDGPPDPAWPGWATALDDRVRSVADRLERALLPPTPR